MTAILDNGQEALLSAVTGLYGFSILEDGVIEKCRVRRSDGSLSDWKAFAKPVRVEKGDTLYVSVDFNK